jgi:hypothetical protein
MQHVVRAVDRLLDITLVSKITLDELEPVVLGKHLPVARLEVVQSPDVFPPVE